jgi:hypothetical protein
MKKRMHCSAVSRMRGAQPAVTNFTVKLEATTDIIDRLLLVPRQAPWKATGPSGTSTDTGTTDTGTTIGTEL